MCPKTFLSERLHRHITYEKWRLAPLVLAQPLS